MSKKVLILSIECQGDGSSDNKNVKRKERKCEVVRPDHKVTIDRRPEGNLVKWKSKP